MKSTHCGDILPGRPAFMGLEPLEPRLLLSGSISGTVYDLATEELLGGVWVEVYRGSDPDRADNQAWDWVTSRQTDGSGQYTVDGLDARHYRVRVPDGASSGSTHYINADLYDVVVVDGATTADMDLALRQAGILGGFVYDELGQPIEDAHVLVEAEYQEDGDDSWRPGPTPRGCTASTWRPRTPPSTPSR
jgi:hypothetical protein